MRAEEFKEAVGKFPTGVTVVSTFAKENLWGFTANSFVSVSLDPSLVSFCLDKKSGSFHAFNEANYFAINILSTDQEHLARHFAQKGSDKFANIDHKITAISKNPQIAGVLCFIECKKYKQFECGDHVIFIGEVMTTHIDNTKSPLVYFAKSYKKIK